MDKKSIDNFFNSLSKDELKERWEKYNKYSEGGEGEKTELLPDVAYWRNRCLLAEKCLYESPCDPDITGEQINAHKDYNQFLKTFGEKN